MNKARLEAFSDGVFSIAATLLVLGLVLPEFKQGAPTDPELWSALLRLWPSFLVYLMSFAVIGIMWQNHHALFRLVAHVDRMAVFLNLGLMGVTAFIPFATSVLGAYPTLRSSTFVYGVTLTASSIFYNLLLMHLERSHAFEPSVSKPTIRASIVAYRVGLATYTIAMLASLVLPPLGFALYLLVIGYYLFPHGADTSTRSASRAAGVRRSRKLH